MNELGARLARAPNDDALARLLQSACDRLHQSEMAAAAWEARIAKTKRMGLGG